MDDQQAGHACSLASGADASVPGVGEPEQSRPTTPHRGSPTRPHRVTKALKGLDAALGAVPGSQERPGQRAMVEAVAHGAGLRRAPAGAGRHRHRQVARLPRAGARLGQAGGRRDGHQGAAGPAGRQGPAPPGDGAEPRSLGRTPTYALAKGRGNYVCLQQVSGGPGAREDEPESLFDGPQSSLGTQVVRLREWAGETETGDRDEVPFPVTGPRLAAGVGQRPRVPGQHAARAAVDCFSREGRARPPRRPTSSSPTTRCSRSTCSPACRCCRSATRSSSTRRTSSSRRSPTRSRTS